MKSKLAFSLSLFLFLFNAIVLNSQSTNISLDFENVSLKDAFKEIRKNSDYKILYRKSEVDLSKNVSINVENASIEEILNHILKDLNVAYKLVGRQVIVTKKNSSEAEISDNKNRGVDYADNRQIGGTVLDQYGNPLAGVNIVLLGTSVGSVTDLDGKYSISAQRGSTLEFIYLGKKTFRSTINASNKLDVVMQDDTGQLEEVVVSALGLKKVKRATAYSISVIEGDNIAEAKEINLGNSLQGKVAGVNVTNIASGSAGSSRVIIRGNSSLQGHNQPLYVIDGIPIDNQNLGSAGIWGGRDQGDGIGGINPDDIENITVLKGNTAAALYGFRASNGVILLTTKTGDGAIGDSPQIEINSNFVVDQAINRLDTQTEYGHGAFGVKPGNFDEALAFGDLAWGGKLDGSQVYQFDGVQRPYVYAGDNFDKFYKTGTTFTNTVSLYGKNEKISYRFSASDLSNQGIIPNSSLKRNNFSINAHGTSGKKLSFRFSGTYIAQKVDNPPAQGDIVNNVNYTVWSLAPSINVRNLIGQNPPDWGVKADGTELTPSKNIWFGNPYYSAYEITNTSERTRFLGSLSVQYDFNDWLYVNARSGIDQWNRANQNVRPDGSAIFPTGDLDQGQTKFKETNNDILVGSRNNIGRYFRYDVLLGGSQMRQEMYSNTTDGTNFAVPGWINYNNALNRTGSVNSYNLGVNSLYGSAELSYKSKVFLTLTGRKDWYSTLNGGNTFYPSIGVSSLVSEMVQLPSFVSFLKTRVAWAEVGGGEGTPYALNQDYAVGIPHNGVPQGGISQPYIVNSNLAPYRVKEFEIGFEASMLNERLGIDFAYYNRTTEDDILNALISGASGYNSAKVNVGKLTNKGIELLVLGTLIKKNDFVWDASLNISYNKSKVISLMNPYVNGEILNLGQNRALTAYISNVEGLPYGQVTGWKYLKDDTGDLVLTDAGLPQRDTEAGLVPFGTGVHPFLAGFTTTLKYKRFLLEFLIDYKGGAVLFSGTNSWLYRSGMHKNTLVGRENGIGIIPASQIEAYYNEITGKIAEEFIYDASFSKLRELKLGYTFPETMSQKFGIKEAKISLVGRNLLLLYSNVENIDPESNYNESNAQGMDYFQTPQSRSYGINLNLKF